MTAFPRSGLYAVTSEQHSSTDGLLKMVAEAIAGGAVAVQYRAKQCAAAILEEQAGRLLALCRERGVPMIVNDDVALARRVGADGVHVGREDASYASARATLGPHAIVGVSCYASAERARAANTAGATYVAFGSFFPSVTKPHAERADVALLGQVRGELALPIVAIGGITADNGAGLIEAGADLLAVISGVFGKPAPRAAAREFAELFASRSHPNV